MKPQVLNHFGSGRHLFLFHSAPKYITKFHGNAQFSEKNLLFFLFVEIVPLALQEIMSGFKHWAIIAVLCYDVNWKQSCCNTSTSREGFFLAINFGILFQIFQSLARYPQLFCWHIAAVAPSLRWVGGKFLLKLTVGSPTLLLLMAVGEPD